MHCDVCGGNCAFVIILGVIIGLGIMIPLWLKLQKENEEETMIDMP